VIGSATITTGCNHSRHTWFISVCGHQSWQASVVRNSSIFAVPRDIIYVGYHTHRICQIIKMFLPKKFSQILSTWFLLLNVPTNTENSLWLARLRQAVDRWHCPLQAGANLQHWDPDTWHIEKLKSILKMISHSVTRIYRQTIYMSLTRHYIQNSSTLTSHAHIYINFCITCFDN